MSVNQTNVIDAISIRPDGNVSLTISDHHSWEEPWHLSLLQDKINSYLQFIETGQIFDDYPDASGKELIIQTVMKYEPTEEAISFFLQVREIVMNVGIGFEWGVLDLKE